MSNGTIVNDFRFAARRLRAAPLFTLFAVLSLAIGVGVTTIAYSVVGDLVYTSLSIRNPDRVVAVVQQSGRGSMTRATPVEFDELQRVQRSFSAMAAWDSYQASVVGVERTVLVPAEAVSGDYFRTVGVEAVRGRMIQPADDIGRAAVAVLGQSLWREQFASAPDVIGRAVRIGGRPFEVIGIAPDDYAGIVRGPARRGTAVWVPLDTVSDVGRAGGATPIAPQLTVIGRLRPGVGVAAAAGEVAALAAALDTSDPQTIVEQGVARVQKRGWTARGIVDIHAQSTPANRLGIVFAFVVTMVLVVACTNLSNLVLARGTLRQQDVVVRRALGAGHWRLVREQLAESVIIAAAGGFATYAVMRVTAAAAARDLPLFAFGVTDVSLSIRPDVDMTTLGVATVALLISLIVFGLEPAIRLARVSDVRGSLATATSRMGRVGRYRVLLRWQIAVSTAFFIIAVVAVRYVVADLRHDPGIRLDGLVVAQMDSGQGRSDATVRRAWEGRLLEESRRARNIESAAVATGLPFGTMNSQVRLSTTDPRASVNVGYRAAMPIAATPNLLSVLGVPILRGRPFDDRDDAAAPHVAIVNETAANALFGSTDVIGRAVYVTRRGSQTAATPATIVGVARDTDTLVYMASERSGVIYTPLAQDSASPTTAVARARGDEDAAVAALQAAIRRADADVAVVRIGAGWEMLSGPFSIVRFVGNASLLLGALTLILAMVGLYGIQSQGVTLRTREIGVRLSFGATAGQIKRMVLMDGYRPVVEGLVLGLAGGLVGRAFIRIYLDVPLSVVDPWMLALVPLPLVFAAFCAGYLPARNAARVDPNVALRDL
jgi:putative ABC transport system permease protein